MSAQPAQLPASREPAVVAVCLDWLHDSLPWPRAPRGWSDAGSGFTRPTGRSSAASWRQCEQCNGRGEIRRGVCGNCDGLGGWHYDPMDSSRAALRSSSDAHPERDAPVVRIVKLSTQTDGELTRHQDEYPPALRHVIGGLSELRARDRYQRAILQRVYVLRLDSPVRLNDAESTLLALALVHLTQLLPEQFRAPRWARERAARALAGLHS